MVHSDLRASAVSCTYRNPLWWSYQRCIQDLQSCPHENNVWNNRPSIAQIVRSSKCPYSVACSVYTSISRRTGGCSQRKWCWQYSRSSWNPACSHTWEQEESSGVEYTEVKNDLVLFPPRLPCSRHRKGDCTSWCYSSRWPIYESHVRDRYNLALCGVHNQPKASDR
jgi:hypothetical protein